MSLLYLKPNVVAEPLQWGWYSWSHLLSPMTACMNIAYRHIPLMEKFIKDPEKYKKINNQKFDSGPLIQLESDKVDKIKSLLLFTKKECEKNIKLAESIKIANNILSENADGGTLEKLYDVIPFSLRGMIECVYDVNNNPYIKYIEPIFYEEYYNHNNQSLNFYTLDSDWRPFILGTPRLDEKECINIPCDFGDNALDKIFMSQFYGVEKKDLLNSFSIKNEHVEHFLSFFNDTPPAAKQSLYTNKNDVLVRYFGHACIFFKTKNCSILFDPLISYDYDTNIDRFTFNELPEKIDYVVISHAHQDHFSIENLLKIRHKTKNVIIPRNSKGNLADPSLRIILKKLGFSSIIELDEMEELIISDGSIMGIPFTGEHAELDIQTKLCFLISLNKKRFCLAVDTNVVDINVYKKVFQNIASVDVLFIGMECDGGPLNWLYGPLLTKELDPRVTATRTLSGSNFEKAYAFAKLLGCKEAYVYSMGQEPWLNYIMNINYTDESIQIKESDLFIEQCRQDGIISERLFAKKEWVY